MVITFALQEAVTPGGKFDGVPIPVAPCVVWVIGVKAVLTHKVGAAEPAPAVLLLKTVAVTAVRVDEIQPVVVFLACA
jgi:hypothetical protein